MCNMHVLTVTDASNKVTAGAATVFVAKASFSFDRVDSVFNSLVSSSWAWKRPSERRPQTTKHVGAVLVGA